MPKYFGVGKAYCNDNIYTSGPNTGLNGFNDTIQVQNTALVGKRDYSFCDQIELLPYLIHPGVLTNPPLFEIALSTDPGFNGISANVSLIFDVSKGESLFLPVYGDSQYNNGVSLWAVKAVVSAPGNQGIQWNFPYRWIYTKTTEPCPTYVVINREY